MSRNATQSFVAGAYRNATEITFNNATNQRIAIYLSNLSLELSQHEVELQDIRVVLTDLHVLESETWKEIESVNKRRRIDRSKCTRTSVISTFDPVYRTETGPILSDLETLFNRCDEMRQPMLAFDLDCARA
jgi:hypothetical protein